MNRLASQRGATVVEILAAVVIVAIMGIVIAKAMKPTQEFLQRFRVKNEMASGARRSADVISRLLRNANPSTVVISTPVDSTPPAPPNSRVDFQSMRGGNYAIYWSSAPINSVYLQTPKGRSVIASHVTGLMFTGDIREPSIVSFTIRMDASFDKSDSDLRIYTTLLPNQVVRMAASEQ